MFNLRIGNGVDFHKFSKEEEGSFEVPLGGIKVPFKKKIMAHSDGDVILHAMCDCIFGAIGNGNIGSHFPPSDPKWKDANSEIFLEYARSLLKGEVINFDVTVVCEAPKVMPYSEKIKNNIARILKIEPSRIGIKAVTTENMGFLGRGEGIGCFAVGLFNLY